MLESKEFISELGKYDFKFFTGVPDSLLKSFCAYLQENIPENNHIIAANEGSAVGIAAGHYLSTGKIPVVYMQNSGLGNAVNPCTSLVDPEVYGIPVLLIIGWRGEPGIKDEPQHIKMGKMQNNLLEALDIPYQILPQDNHKASNVIKHAHAYMKSNNAPYALVVQKNTFKDYISSSKQTLSIGYTREDVLKNILPVWGDSDIIISTTGKASREIFEMREEHHRDFLCVGSMGHASSIALGIAINKPERKVWCIDGDGALLMHMGSLSTIGKVKPKNLFHIILNNFTHDSVGGQPTGTENMDIVSLARSCGYANAHRAQSIDEIKKVCTMAQEKEGPWLIEIPCDSGSRNNLGRPTISPSENKKHFMNFLQ